MPLLEVVRQLRAQERSEEKIDGAHMKYELKELARQFFTGVYEGNPSIVEELAAEDIVATYPIFMRLFNTPTLRGRKAYMDHAINFSRTWKNGKVTIHEFVTEGYKVILLWSFRAQRVSPDQAPGLHSREEHHWGGITLIRFNETGKVVAEIGEESEPGPQARLSAVQFSNER